MLYFAYGSNLSHKQMLARCPKAKFFKVATLANYSRQFDGHSERWGGAVANIIPTKNSSVTGALFEIDDEHLKSLDGYEGYGIRYDRQVCTVTVGDGTTREAHVYLRLVPHPIGKPTLDYMRTIEEGLSDCGIEYVEELT